MPELQTANVVLALGGDARNTVPKYAVTAAEVAVLRMIHGDAAVFDVARIAEPLTVRLAQGDEAYETFAGETEHPEPGEVVFADASGRAHARRWTHRQSGWSAVRAKTARALIVAEALHDTAEGDVAGLMSMLGEALRTTWPGCTSCEVAAR